MAGIALAEPTLVKQIEQWGQETNRSAEKIVENAVQVYLDNLEREAIRAETQTFWTIHDELVETYLGHHVALYKGKVVDHDEDVVRLQERVRTKFGFLPVLIAPVSQGPRHDLRWLGGRLVANATG